jgi:hypothetical protein
MPGLQPCRGLTVEFLRSLKPKLINKRRDLRFVPKVTVGATILWRR